VTRKDINFIVPKEYRTSRLFLYFMSDSYIGLDQQYIIDIDRVNNIIMRHRPAEKKAEMPESQNDISLSSIKEEFSNREYLPYIEKKEGGVEEEDVVTDEEEGGDNDEELIFDNW
jgi:hypothetical protein